MKYHSVPTSKFAKDYERLKKRGKEIRKLARVIDALLAGEKLATKYRDHALTGDCNGCRECHIEPDWLLLYEIQGEDMIWLRTGTHSDLFG
ncbi:MAG: type II toxin-antitoxin system YafQ family toxin [Negativicutes bacterium]